MWSYLTIDFSVNKLRSSKLILFTYRLGNYLQYSSKSKIVKALSLPFYRLFELLFIKILAGAEIPAKCQIGTGCWLMHGAKGIIIHPDTVIGNNARIFHQVTIGANDPRKSNGYGIPTIGDNVFIGAGAKILGPITIGNNVIIGANAVVVTNIPSNSTAIGVPAKIRVK